MTFFASGLNNRSLILRMTRREVIGRYQGSYLGLLWSLLNPLIMLAVYGFVFGIVFRAKWGVSEVEHNFAVILFSGLIFHGLLAECLTRSPSLVVANVNFVKKVVFPLEALAWVALLSASFHFLVSAGILLAVQFVVGSVPWTWVFFPMIAAPLFFLCLGLNWFLSSLGVFVRDIGQLMALLAVILLFLCPIFYPLEVIPAKYQFFIQLNPLSLLVEQARQVLVFGQMPDFVVLGIYTLGACLLSQLGFWWFQKTKRGFSDVL